MASASTLHTKTDTPSLLDLNAVTCQHDLRDDVCIHLVVAVSADASGDLSSVAWPTVDDDGTSEPFERASAREPYLM